MPLVLRPQAAAELEAAVALAKKRAALIARPVKGSEPVIFDGQRAAQSAAKAVATDCGALADDIRKQARALLAPTSHA